ncbi:NUDIX domain-containing protein [Arthrobacter cupressi]
MVVLSAGILLYRRGPATGSPADSPAGPPADSPASPLAGSAPGPRADLEVWIAHMGGPFWANKEVRAWSVPKGEYSPGEEPWLAAQREFAEEMGSPPPPADYFRLGDFKQPSGKVITVFAAESDFTPEEIRSNTFPLEWPKGSGRIQQFPEIDRAAWTAEAEARALLVRGQVPVLDALLTRLGGRPPGPAEAG